ncbi:DUF1707 and DUF4870 domain-containing protein [Actinomadura sp. KC345]|uniref:DUF1707 and DUF4870 domain-containing protein n=1 Tax=Actinomadura sp. KC345 TaxID=2530371 RepID=UPI001043F80D|nr:DUF1707 and DUF4870 domain-containing protein [Actinomadura sp. KC345]TDC47020.1 DUF1707 and DUF4870 domain-containing protein [Actinomadura sp. KC345]
MDSSYAVGDLRVSDAEREPVIERLQDAYAEGRLDHEEFDLRMHLAMTAKTRNDLAALTRDLTPEPRLACKTAAWDGDPPTGEDRMLASAAHAIAVPTLFVGPLVLMLLSGKRSEYVRRQAAEAVNFQLTLLLVTIVTFGIGGVVYAVAWVLSAIAAVYALSGSIFRYPWILRLVK